VLLLLCTQKIGPKGWTQSSSCDGAGKNSRAETFSNTVDLDLKHEWCTMNYDTWETSAIEVSKSFNDLYARQYPKMASLMLAIILYENNGS
jgi:hypothetical protein